MSDIGENSLLDMLLAPVPSDLDGDFGNVSSGESGSLDVLTTLWPSTPASTNGTNATIFPSVADDVLIPSSALFFCSKWSPANHIFFQLANAFLFLSYLAPNGIYGILYLRSTLMIGCFFFAIWGWMIICALDTFVWNALFVLINFVHFCVLLFYLRPVKFEKEIENLYRELFVPLKVSRHQFKKVLGCMKEIKTVRTAETYAVEKHTRVDKLSLVISGRLVVSQSGKPLHVVGGHQFLDSPEWFGVSTDEFFQVTITAVEESRILVWNRDKLKLTINGDSFLQAIFDHILGKDVVKKLMQVNECIMTTNGKLPCMSINEDKCYDDSSDDYNSPLTALLSKQAKGSDADTWRLGNIREEEHETTV